MLICGDAGIGRQASLRCLCQYWRVGSSPISRTSVKDIRFSSVLYFYISANQQISKVLSSKTVTLESHEIFDFVEAEFVPQSDTVLRGDLYGGICQFQYADRLSDQSDRARYR